MAEAPEAPSTAPTPKKRAPFARAGLAVVGLVSVGLTFASSSQIIRAALFPADAGGITSCKSGVDSLYRSMDRARRDAAAETAGETAALHDFRTSLEPEWSRYGAVRAQCQREAYPKGQAALRNVELLRYAEERAVRYDALDLSRLRRTTPGAIEALSSPAASP